MTRSLCFSVDVDRDANECVPGKVNAVSRGGGIRFTSSGSGTDSILDMLNDIGMKATFFAEARTLQNISASFGNNEVSMHGLDHEDMTGEVSGIPLTEDELNKIMQDSADIIKDHTGKAPEGFRAPYMRINKRVTDVLSKYVRYDSSVYAALNSTMHPYDTGNGMKEIPVPAVSDKNGKKMYAYLWPMHEGKRTYEEYVRMADAVKDGVFVLATHSWHMAETISGGVMSPIQRQENADSVRKVLTGILDSGFRAARMSDVI